MKKIYSYSISSAFFDIANNLMRVFGIVFFYIKSGNNIYIALGAYLVTEIFNVILLLFIPKWIGKLGTKTSLIISRFFFFATAIPVFFLNENNYLVLLLVWSLLYAIARTFLFIPYHYIVMSLTAGNKRANDIGILFAISSFLGILAPFIAGYISSNFGNIGYSILIALSFIVSIAFLKDTPNFKFTYTGSFLKSIDLKNVRRELKYTGVANLQNQYGFWQIYIFNLLQNNFLNLGFVTTAVNLIGTLINILLGRWLDSHNKKQMIKLSGLLQSSGWLMRLLVNSPLGVVVSDSYMKITGQLLSQTLTVFTYDLLTENGNEIVLDEKLIVREFFLTIIGICTFSFAIIIYALFGFQAVFILAIIASFSLTII